MTQTKRVSFRIRPAVRALALLTALLLFPLSAPAEGLAVCPACGSESAGLYCARCGARLTGDEEPPALTDPLSRTAGRIAFQTTDELAALYGTAPDAETPVYTPKAPQPMNAYLVFDTQSEIAINNDGIHPFEKEHMDRISPLLKEWAKETEDESLGAVRFVPDPDEADLLIVARQTFPVAGRYGLGGGVTGHACKVELTAYRLTEPGRTAAMAIRENPPSKVTIRVGSTRFWENPPELAGSKELRAFVEEVLGWYGYGSREEIAVQALQQALLDRGAYSGPADGQDSAALRFALRQFQALQGLPATGAADKATVIALYYGRRPDPENEGGCPVLPEAVEVTLTRPCGACGWIYAADEDCAFCEHCGAELPHVYTGSRVFFGTFEQDNDMENGPEPIEWIVLDVRDGKALLMSRYGLDVQPYSTVGDVSWETCTLRAWLNGEFLNTAFTAQEAAAIAETTVDNGEGQAYVEKWGYGSDGDASNDTVDRIYLLSPHEGVDVYRLSAKDLRCAPTDYAIARGAYTIKREDKMVDGRYSGNWWSRVSADGFTWAVFMPDGYNDFDTANVCVRPVLWVDLSACSF